MNNTTILELELTENIKNFINTVNGLEFQENSFEITAELFSVDGKKRYFKKIKDKVSNYLKASIELGNYLKLEIFASSLRFIHNPTTGNYIDISFSSPC